MNDAHLHPVASHTDGRLLNSLLTPTAAVSRAPLVLLTQPRTPSIHCGHPSSCGCEEKQVSPTGSLSRAVSWVARVSERKCYSKRSLLTGSCGQRTFSNGREN